MYANGIFSFFIISTPIILSQ